jgi:hypothetical protein
MREFLSFLLSLYRKYSAEIKAITSFLAILGVTNNVPDPWWQSPLLLWSISSQTAITIVLLLLSIILFVWLKNRELKSEIKMLLRRKEIDSLTPEEYAELTKEKLVYAARYYYHLLGLNKQSQYLKEDEGPINH